MNLNDILLIFSMDTYSPILEEGVQFIKEDDIEAIEKTISNFEKSLSMNPNDTPLLYFLKSYVIYYKKDYFRTQTFLQKAFKQSRKLNLYPLTLEILLKQGEIARYTQEQSKAFEWMNEAHNILSHFRIQNEKNNLSLNKKEITKETFLKHISYKKGQILKLEGLLHIDRDEIPEGIKNLKQSLEIMEKLGLKEECGTIHYYIGKGYYIQRNSKLGIYHTQKSIEYTNESNLKLLTQNYINLACIYQIKGDFKNAKKFLKKSEKLANILGEDEIIVTVIHNLGNFLFNNGELEESLEYYQKALTIRERLQDKDGIARSLQNIGLIYLHKGNLSLGLKYTTKSTNLFEELKNKRCAAIGNNNIGEIYRKRGLLDDAERSYQKAFYLSTEIDAKGDQAGCLHNLAIISYYKGDIAKAQDNFEKSINLWEETQNNLYISNTLLEYIIVSLQILNVLNEQYNEIKVIIEQNFQKLRKIKEQEENLIIDCRFSLAKSLILLETGDLEKIFEAKKLLESIINKSLEIFDISISARLFLCRVYLDLYIRMGTKSSMNKLEEHLRYILLMAKRENLTETVLMAFYLQSKLFLLKANTQEAELSFLNLREEAKRKGFDWIEHQVEEELTDITGYLTLPTTQTLSEKYKSKYNNKQVNEIITLLNKVALNSLS